MAVSNRVDSQAALFAQLRQAGVPAGKVGQVAQQIVDQTPGISSLGEIGPGTLLQFPDSFKLEGGKLLAVDPAAFADLMARGAVDGGARPAGGGLLGSLGRLRQVKAEGMAAPGTVNIASDPDRPEQFYYSARITGFNLNKDGDLFGKGEIYATGMHGERISGITSAHAGHDAAVVGGRSFALDPDQDCTQAPLKIMMLDDDHLIDDPMGLFEKPVALDGFGTGARSEKSFDTEYGRLRLEVERHPLNNVPAAVAERLESDPAAVAREVGRVKYEADRTMAELDQMRTFFRGNIVGAANRNDATRIQLEIRDQLNEIRDRIATIDPDFPESARLKAAYNDKVNFYAGCVVSAPVKNHREEYAILFADDFLLP